MGSGENEFIESVFFTTGGPVGGDVVLHRKTVLAYHEIDRRIHSSGRILGNLEDEFLLGEVPYCNIVRDVALSDFFTGEEKYGEQEDVREEDYCFEF